MTMLGFATALVLLRYATLLTALDTVSLYEELYRGTIASELVDGLKAPLLDYQADDYSGGSLAVGLAAAPLFRLFGPRLLALKAVPVLFSLAAMLLLYAFVRRQFGERAGAFAAGLYVFAPPGFAQVSSLAMGFHAESVVPSTVILIAFSAFFYGAERPIRAAVLFGLASGLALSFTYITALTLAACLVAWVILDARALAGRLGAAAALGGALGLGPWLLYNAGHEFAGLRFALGTFGSLDSTLSVSGVAAMGRKAVSIFVYGIPLSMASESVSSSVGVPLAYLYYGAAAVLAGSLLVTEGRGWWTGLAPTARLLPLGVYVPLFVAAYAASRLPVPRTVGYMSYRFFAPLTFIGFMLVAVALTRRRHARWWFGALAAAGLAGQLSLLGSGVPAHIARYRGEAYFLLGQLWEGRLFPDSVTFAEAAPLLARFGERERRFVYWGLVDAKWGLIEARRPRRGDPIAALARLAEVPEAYRVYFLEAVGDAIGLRGLTDLPRVAPTIERLDSRGRDAFYRGFSREAVHRYGAMAEYLRTMSTADASVRRWFALNLGFFSTAVCYRNAADAPEACVLAASAASTLSGDGKGWMVRGAGEVAGGAWLATRGLSDLVAGIDGTMMAELTRRLSGEREPFFRGVGWGLRDALREDRAQVVDRIAALPGEARGPAATGLHEYDAWYGLVDAGDGGR